MVVFTTVVILLLIAGIILSFLLSARKQAKQQLELAQAKLEYEKEIRQVETEVREEVLGHVGRELHDDIGQQLVAAHIEIQNQKINHPDLVTSYQSLENYISHASQQLRLLSRTHNADFLQHNGLWESIRLEVERLRGLKRFAEIKWQMPEQRPDLDKNQELMVFRIFQEIVQNALKHSKAKCFSIEVISVVPFSMCISDDGKGFDVQTMLASSKASGLRNITKRAQLTGINCEIQSQPGKGTSYTLKR